MADNLSPEVAIAQKAAHLFGADRVIILYFPKGKRDFYSVTYTEDEALCAETDRLADVASAALTGHNTDEIETTYKVYGDEQGRYRWRKLRGSNVTADSGFGYSTKASAKRAAQRDRLTPADAPIIVEGE